MLKRLFLTLLSPLAIGVIFMTPAQAQEVNQEGDVIYLGTTATASPTPQQLGVNNAGTSFTFAGTSLTIPAGYFPDFKTLMTWLLQVALIVSVLLVLFQLVYAGVNWITSGGDKGKTDSARSRIVAAIIGLVIVVASWAIFLFVLQLLGIAPGTVLPMFVSN